MPKPVCLRAQFNMSAFDIDLRKSMVQTRKPYLVRHRKSASLQITTIGFLAIIVFFSAYNLKIRGLCTDKLNVNPDAYSTAMSRGPRHLLWHSFKNTSSQPNPTKNDSKISPSRPSCIPPSIKEFPQDPFSLKQLRHGAVVIHIMVSIYMFLALAFVCDDYFVASLDCICENLHLNDDIAGATFMAAGSSAPELFTSLIGLLITHGDVGTGTIVGSAVFNILIILALVSIWAGQETKLTRWPLCRDSFAYCISIIALIGVMSNGYIEWYESIILLLLYVGYLILMKFNSKIRRLDPNTATNQREIENSMNMQSSDVEQDYPEVIRNAPYNYGGPGSYQLEPKTLRRLTWKDVGMMIMLSSQFPPATRFRAACYMVTLRQEDETSHLIQDKSLDTEDEAENEKRRENVSVADIEIEVGPFTNESDSTMALFFRIVSKPIVILLHFTIPDCKKERWHKWYMATFFMSIFWIGMFSYVMVWMVTVIGFTLEIPDVIMGITFLAAGTSIPDAIASLIVSRQGQGDMAVSNSIGSNVFDILIGLALPWFIKTSLLHPGSKVKVNSRGLKYSVVLLLGSVLITVLTILLNKWKLDKRTGYTFMLVYLIFISFSCLIEFNVFGFVNLPICKFSW